MPANPYSTKFASGEIDYTFNPTQLMKQFKKEEKLTHKGPNVLPYELGDLPNHFAQMIENGIQACKIIEASLKEPTVKNKKELSKLKKNTEKMLTYLIQNVDPILSHQTIGYNAKENENEKYEELG